MTKNSMKKIMAILLAALFLVTTACTSKDAGKNEAASSTGVPTDVIGKDTVSYKATLTAQTIAAFPEAFTAGINQYGFNSAASLYSGENLAISPASLELAMLMTRAGAVGATSEEMKKALSMSGLSDDEILNACKQLMWRTNTNKMEAANSIWMQKDYSFNTNYINTCVKNFMADAFAVDFKTDAAAATDLINKWASDKTHGKILKMNSEPLPTNTRLVLMNALYFLGDWEIPFKAENTYEQPFNGTAGTSSVKFMHDEREMLYSQTSSYQMISLPFKGEKNAADSPYSMAFILPAEGQDVAALLKSFASDGFAASAKNLVAAKVQLALPKFEFSFGTSMIKTMQALGMNLAFDSEKAQFDNMTGGENDLSISEILHKCYIRVDEKGAEAAAVTEVSMDVTCAQPDDNLKIFTADRPFIFAIYDKTDNTVLFLGAIGKL